jgi:transcriptional regulator with XRE-family HTH domain
VQKEAKYTYISEVLRRLRVKADFSQQNVADALNLNRSTYTYYETGKTTPDVRTLYKIAQIFGVPVEIFFPDEGQISLLEDPAWDTNKLRPKKKVEIDPDHVGDLSGEEKSLIAWLRAHPSISAEDTLEALKRRVDQEEK